MKTKSRFSIQIPSRDTLLMLQRAYEEWARLPMPKIDEKHLFDRSRHELEEAAIRREIKWIARKYGLTFKILDTYIEERSKEL